MLDSRITRTGNCLISNQRERTCTCVDLLSEMSVRHLSEIPGLAALVGVSALRK